jgi:hypothetical protein
MLTSELLVAMAGSGALGAIGSGIAAVLKFRSEAASSESRVMEVVHDVYDETVEMLREEITDNREQIILLQDALYELTKENARLRGRIVFLESWIIRRGFTVPKEEEDGEEEGS